MEAPVKYGALLTGGGLLMWMSGLANEYNAVLYISTAALVIGGGMRYLAYEKWYCAACGQVLSRGQKPDRCERCGSNRVTTNDPGAVR